MTSQSVLVCPRCREAHFYFGPKKPMPEFKKSEFIFRCVKCGHQISIFVKIEE